MSEEPKVETVTKTEDKGGFRIQWKTSKERREAISFDVWQIVNDGPIPMFIKRDGTKENPLTPIVDDSEPYLSGIIHIDGRVWLGGSHVMMGAAGVQRHIGMLKYLWHRAHKHIGGDQGLKAAHKEWVEAING